jgi:hypothetical protein
VLYLVTCSIDRFDARFRDLDAAVLYCETITRRYAGQSPLYATICDSGCTSRVIYKYLRGCSI